MSLKPDELQVGMICHVRTHVVNRSEIESCAYLLGEDDNTEGESLGIVFVWALQALMDSEILPQGAIMLTHYVKWVQLPPVTGSVKTEIKIKSVDHSRRRYSHVVINYITRDENGREIAKQNQGVLWPK